MNPLVKFMCGGLRREMAIALLECRAAKRERKLILARIDENKCIVSFGYYCGCQDCQDYGLALDIVADASSKEQAIKFLKTKFPADKAEEYGELMDETMGFPV